VSRIGATGFQTKVHPYAGLATGILSCRMHALRLTLTLLLLTVAESLHAQRRLSPDATISVITCGPGQNELYSAFGHSALRVYDPRQQIDEAYNYGVFDFDQPHFYLNFARGYLYYQLAVWDYQAFASMYMYEN